MYRPPMQPLYEPPHQAPHQNPYQPTQHQQQQQQQQQPQYQPPPYQPLQQQPQYQTPPPPGPASHQPIQQQPQYQPPPPSQASYPPTQQQPQYQSLPQNAPYQPAPQQSPPSQYQPPPQQPPQYQTSPQQPQYQPPPQQQAYQPSYQPTYQPPYQPPRQTLDQHAMPSPAQLINDEIETYKQTDKKLVFTAPASLPPLVTTLESDKLKMSLQDGGCVRPCHMRSTIYKVPINKDLLDSSGLELSVVIKPFDEREAEGKFYTALSPSQIVRCNRCKAYINPFSRNGQCCICNYTIQGLQEFEQKPELQYGSYEYRVTEEYFRDGIPEIRRPHIIFAIEMTVSSRHIVQHISRNLADIIKNYFPSDFLYEDKLTPLVGFVTYNSKITVYDVKNGGHAYTVCDMSAVVAPSSQFLVDPMKNFAEIESFLASLESLCQDQLNVEEQTVLGPVLEAALKTSMVDTSNLIQSDPKKAPNPKVVPTGKIYIFHASLPTYGDEQTPGRLTAKRNIDEMKRQLGTETESKTIAVEGKYYTQLAQRCVTEYGTGVELFLFPPHPRAYLNIATIGELSKWSGTGVINKYHISSLENFLQDLKISLKSTMGFDASMRVRTSTGISPVRYIGNFTFESPQIWMSTVNTTSNFAVQIKYDDKLPENDLVVIQFAMIYTSVCGERRVRVHNLALETCQVIADLYKSACCDTLVNVLLRDTIDKMRGGTLAPKTAKEQLTARVISILAAYRKHCTDNPTSTSSQLILPENLKLLPVYLCGALKCDAIDGGMEMMPDDKVLAQMNLLGALPLLSQVTIYPRMYSIEACEAEDEENEYGLTAVLTRCFELAIKEAEGQCYVLENGYYLFIFFPSTEIGQSFLSNVFGIRKDDPEPLLWDLRQKEASESRFLEGLVEQIMSERRRALKINIVRQGRDKMEAVFRTFLYEDKKRPEGIAANKLDNASYVEILCYLHKEIKDKLSQ